MAETVQNSNNISFADYIRSLQGYGKNSWNNDSQNTQLYLAGGYNPYEGSYAQGYNNGIAKNNDITKNLDDNKGFNWDGIASWTNAIGSFGQGLAGILSARAAQKYQKKMANLYESEINRNNQRLAETQANYNKIYG
jgi:hypothetical protein